MHNFLLLAAATLAAAPSEVTERRCGWYHNSSPANVWLSDRDGDWVLERMGGTELDGMDNLPKKWPDWVATNGSSYGYGCACLTLVIDHKAPRDEYGRRLVKRLVSGKVLPLRQCRADKRLPKP